MRPFSHRTHVRNTSTRVRKARLQVEALESRLTPYALSGNSWLQSQLVSLSFMPDGTNLGGATSSMFSAFNARWSQSVWQKELLRAAQVWAQQTNINFTLVPDDGSASGSGAYQQGAGNFGDIRIGAFSGGSGWLGMGTFAQPTCNYSVNGDYTLNLSQPWVINTTGGYDLFTVAAHEVGHGLGLTHSTLTSAVMYGMYSGIKSILRADDINGIRAIYSGSSARAQDTFDAVSSNGTFPSASAVGGYIQNLTALVTDRDITTTADLDYYVFVAPLESSGTLTVKVQSSGLSLLSPLVKIYDAAQVEIASASGLNQYGATLTATATITPGALYYVMVDGADNTAFGTGKYALTLNFGTGPSPTVPLPNTQTANGSPIQCGGGIAQEEEHEHGADHDHDHHDGQGHAYGPEQAAEPTTGTGAAEAVQLLASPAATPAVMPRQERLGETPPAAALDTLFAQAGGADEVRELEVSLPAEVAELDTLFLVLFA
jgi:hypothetical protein